MPTQHAATLDAVAAYYEERVREHGATPWGVDWTCEPTQQLRFVQLLKVAGARGAISINDFGCGYGALLPFLRRRFPSRRIDYRGADVAPAMIEAARAAAAQADRSRFFVGSSLPPADYSVASGVFNVQLGFSPRAWRAHVKEALSQMARASRKGFAVNFMLPPKPGAQALAGLYRARPSAWAAYCREAFGADVEVLQAYGLREFTLLARFPSTARPRGASGRAPSSRTAP
jgi:SAM-dependent methyltransferase